MIKWGGCIKIYFLSLDYCYVSHLIPMRNAHKREFLIHFVREQNNKQVPGFLPDSFIFIRKGGAAKK